MHDNSVKTIQDRLQKNIQERKIGTFSWTVKYLQMYVTRYL